MSIPALTSDGLLPVGIHDCTLEEIKAVFGSFHASGQRPRLFAKLEEFCTNARSSGLVRSVLIDGSFVTGNPSPNDIDLIVVVAAQHDVSADLTPSQYNVSSKFRVRTRFGFDMVAVREDAVEFDEAVAFFQQVRYQPHLRKGVLRVRL